MRVEDMAVTADMVVATVAMLCGAGARTGRVPTTWAGNVMEVVRSKRPADIAWAVGIIRRVDIEGAADTMQVADIIGIAAVTGEAVPGIRTTDILGSAITARAMATHTTELAIMVTAPVGTIRMDTTMPLILTDTR
jgi:hypothetical protein